MGHVNNAVYVTWMEVGRTMFIETFLPPGGPIDMVLAHLGIDFIKETRFPGDVQIGGRLSKIGNTSIETVWGAFQGEQCLAAATCINVFFDVQRRCATSPPESALAWLRQQLAAAPN